jgi:hypothetical protein
MSDKPKQPRCERMIHVRDTYRRTGRGKSRFEMYYAKRQCTRNAVERGLCWQHVKERDPVRVPWLHPPSQWIEQEAE